MMTTPAHDDELRKECGRFADSTVYLGRKETIDALLHLCRQMQAKTWKEAAVDLSHGLPLIWKKALIDRCESKAKEIEHDVGK